MARKRKQISKSEEYTPTPQERASLEAYLVRKKQAPPAPAMKVSRQGGVASLQPDHQEPITGYFLLMLALATTDANFLDGILEL